MKNLITLLLSIFSLTASAELTCSFSSSAFGVKHGLDKIVFEKENMAIYYVDGTSEKLPPEKASAGPFNEIKFTANMHTAFGKEWSYVQVTSSKLGTIQSRDICYFQHSDIYCASQGGQHSTSSVVQFNFEGELVAFDGKSLALCPL